jgi:hypothetical protein
LREDVLELLSKGWSPEQVCGFLERQHGKRVQRPSIASLPPRLPVTRTIPGGAICHAPKQSGGGGAREAAAPLCILSNVFPLPNGLPR